MGQTCGVGRLVAAMSALAVAAFGVRANAQVVVHGSVVEATTKEPVPGATTIIRNARDTVVASAVSNAQGQFTIRFAPQDSETYTVASRRLGYEAREATGIVIRPVDTLSVTVELPRLDVVLDTVRTIAPKKKFLGITWGVTSGRELFADHYREGKGYFFSGQEMMWSQLGACGYFAEVPGLMLSTVPSGVPCGVPPFATHYIASATQPACLVGYVDRIGRLASLDDDNELHVTVGMGGPMGARNARTRSNGTIGIQPLEVPLEDVVGVEVYKNRNELPSDMRRDLDLPISFNCAIVRIWTTQAW